MKAHAAKRRDAGAKVHVRIEQRAKAVDECDGTDAGVWTGSHATVTTEGQFSGSA